MLHALVIALRHWWHHSYWSSWYVYYLTKKHTISLAAYAYTTQSTMTLATFLTRKKKESRRIAPATKTAFMPPCEGIVLHTTSTLLQLRLLPHHYHRLHFPVTGTIIAMHEESPRCHIYIIRGLDQTAYHLTINTLSHPHAFVPTPLPKRNYHLQGTELGCITTPHAEITLQVSKPLIPASSEKKEYRFL